MPLTENPMPFAPTDEIVRLVPPLFVRVSVNVLDAPLVTLPKVKLDGLEAIVAGVTPVAESAIVVVGVGAFEVIATLPLAAPAALALNPTLNVAV